MSAQIAGKSGELLEVNAGHQAARISPYPNKARAWSSWGMVSGVIAAAAINSVLASIRNTGQNLLQVRRLGIQWLTVAPGTVARLDLALQLVRGAAADTGGTAGNAAHGKHKATLESPALDARIAATAGLAAAVASSVEVIAVGGIWPSVAGAGAALPLFTHDSGDYPLTLANNEGLRITNLTAMGATSTGVLYLNLETAEMLPADWTG